MFSVNVKLRLVITEFHGYCPLSSIVKDTVFFLTWIFFHPQLKVWWACTLLCPLERADLCPSLDCGQKQTKLHGLSPRANYTDREAAACWQSCSQLLRIEGVVWSAQWILMAVFLDFWTGAATFSIK
jgi:hypothetical protein